MFKENNGVFEGIDFKFVFCDELLNDDVVRECGFIFLFIWIVKELVIFGVNLFLKFFFILKVGRYFLVVEFYFVF